MFERRLFAYIDWMLVAAIGVLCLIGLVMIFSATYDPVTDQVGSQFYRQIFGIVLGVIAVVVCLVIDYRVLVERSLLLYVGLVALLLYTLFFGIEQGGAQRWIGLGGVNLQPSEFSRAVVALVLAYFFCQGRQGAQRPVDWLIGLAFVGILFFLIAKAPDLGTAVTLLPVFLVMMVFAGLKLRVLATIMLFGLLAAPAVWSYGLQDYQQTRIASFLDPEQDPLGAGYQQIQARITVGSGGLTGRGFLEGTQSQYDFLPVAHNDFIFAVICEELGFLGGAAVIIAFLFILWRGIAIAFRATDPMGRYLATGITAMIVCQAMINLGVVLALLPTKGLPLPFISYGGTAVVTALASSGILLNISQQTK